MKKAFYLICFLFGFATLLQAQQEKNEIPKVNLDNFTPPTKGTQTTNKKASNSGKKVIPKIDLSNFKPPVRKEPMRKKD